MADVVAAADRGSLSLAPRAVTKIAELTALQVKHVVRSSEGIGGLVGRGLPRVSAAIDRDRVRLTLDVAVEWPSPVEAVAADLRRHVAEETGRLTGLIVRSTDVTVHAVSPADARGGSGRRVQ